jgi:hypothetical protein
MDDITPQYTCGSCRRAVLNRRVERCVFCDELLPPGVMLSAAEIAALEAEDRARSDMARRQVAGGGPAMQANNEASPLELIEGLLEIASDLADFAD